MIVLSYQSIKTFLKRMHLITLQNKGGILFRLTKQDDRGQTPARMSNDYKGSRTVLCVEGSRVGRCCGADERDGGGEMFIRAAFKSELHILGSHWRCAEDLHI